MKKAKRKNRKVSHWLGLIDAWISGRFMYVLNRGAEGLPIATDTSSMRAGARRYIDRINRLARYGMRQKTL